MRLDLDLDRLVDEVATRVAAELADRIASQAPSPGMAMHEAIASTRIPAGTFRKWVAAGRIPAHGGHRRLFHRNELDAALGYASAPAAARLVLAALPDGDPASNGIRTTTSTSCRPPRALESEPVVEMVTFRDFDSIAASHGSASIAC